MESLLVELKAAGTPGWLLLKIHAKTKEKRL